MGVIIYGTRVFTKLKGYFGAREECPTCMKTYKKAYIKNTTWAHLDYIPLFPIKVDYSKICPICGNGVTLKSKEAKSEMINSNDLYPQGFEVYAKHILKDKPKGIFSTDNSYEFWVKDLISGEETCVAAGITKDTVNKMKKYRGMKKAAVITIQNQ